METSKYNFNFDPKTKSFSHQSEAINYIEQNDFVALFDEQGLGKTKIVLDALCNNLKNGIIDGALVVCRKNLIQNWQDEIETHSFLKSIVLRGSSKEKGIKFMGFSFFYLINYESVIGEISRLKMFLKVRKLAIVLDESHAIKNPESQTTKSILQLAELAKKRIIISGTPIANKPEDLWSQFYFLDFGKLLGTDYSSFKSMYSTSINDTQKLLANDNLNKLKNAIGANSIRRKKEDVLELPEKIYYDEYVTLKGKQLLMYEKLRDELYIEIKKLDGSVVIDESETILKKLLRLEQIASNPKLIDQSFEEQPAKFPRLIELVKQIVDRDEKLIIWSCFVDNIRILYKTFQSYGSLMIYGDIPIDIRNESISKFKKDPKRKVLISNPAAAKEGLTLTVANNAIYLDRNFNLVDYLQSQDRIHRISQTKKCNIIKLIAKGTIDEYIDEILRRKHSVAGYIQGDSSKLEFKNQLSKAELLNFIGGKKNGKN